MNKNNIIKAVVVSFLIFVFLLISRIVSVLLSLALTIISFIIINLILNMFNEKEMGKAESAKMNQARVLEKAFMKGQTGAFKGYGFNKENKSWVLKKK